MITIILRKIKSLEKVVHSKCPKLIETVLKFGKRYVQAGYWKQTLLRIQKKLQCPCRNILPSPFLEAELEYQIKLTSNETSIVFGAHRIKPLIFLVRHYLTLSFSHLTSWVLSQEQYMMSRKVSLSGTVLGDNDNGNMFWGYYFFV